MKKSVVTVMVILFLITFNTPVDAEIKDDADTNLRQTLKLALLNSLYEPVEQAIDEIYEDDENAPDNLQWSPYQAKVLKVKQIYGKGGLYEITLKVHPYYEAHITYGEDNITINTSGELVNFKHLKTYHYSYD